MLTVEQHKGDCLDACEMRRQGLLDGGRYELDAGIRWPKLSGLIIDRTGIAITLRSGRQQVIPISWARCFSNSARPWLVCECGGRFARLYYSCGGYQCRHCAEMVYACQSVSSQKRMRQKQAAIHRRLGYRYTPQRIRRLKWMRQRTFRRLHAIEQHLIGKLTEYRCRRVIRPEWKGIGERAKA